MRISDWSSDVRSSDLGAQRDRVRLVDHLAPALAGAVEVESIGRILLAIVTARAVEDAVGTDVDEPRTGDAAQSRQAMREQRVDRYRVEHAPRARQLLHDADAVYEDVGAMTCEQLD